MTAGPLPSQPDMLALLGEDAPPSPVWEVIRVLDSNLSREFVSLLMTGDCDRPSLRGGSLNREGWFWADHRGVWIERDVGLPFGLRPPDATWEQLATELTAQVDPELLRAAWEAEQDTWHAYVEVLSMQRPGGHQSETDRDIEQAAYAAHWRADHHARTLLRTLINPPTSGEEADQ